MNKPTINSYMMALKILYLYPYVWKYYVDISLNLTLTPPTGKTKIIIKHSYILPSILIKKIIFYFSHLNQNTLRLYFILFNIENLYYLINLHGEGNQKINCIKIPCKALLINCI